MDQDKLLTHARRLLDFYHHHVFLSGGVSGDHKMFSLANEHTVKSVIENELQNETKSDHLLTMGSVTRVANILIFAHLLEYSQLTRALASFEMMLDFWSRFTPEDVLATISADTPNKNEILNRGRAYQIGNLSYEGGGLSAWENDFSGSSLRLSAKAKE